VFDDCSEFDVSQRDAGHLDLRTAASLGVGVPLTWDCLNTRCSKLGEPDGLGGWLSVVLCGHGQEGGYWIEQGASDRPRDM